MTTSDYYQRISDICNSETSIKLHVDIIHDLRMQAEELGILSDEDRVTISNQIRERVQLEAEMAFHKAHCWGAFYGATGVGKSKVGADYINRLISEDGMSKNLIVVPTEKLRDENWKEEFEKWGYGTVWPKVQRCCYASLSKYNNEDFDSVILDEGHNITEANATFFESNRVKTCMLLSATKPPRFSLKQGILRKLNLDGIYEITLDEAVKLGLVAPYDITIITTHLNNVDKFMIGGRKNARYLQTEADRYKHLSKIITAHPNKITRLMRMQFIYGLRTKTQAAIEILDNYIPKELRTLIFCGNIEQAEEVCEYTFHSKKNKKEKEEHFNLFADKKINQLSCVDALNEGHNIDDLDCAFIVQLNSKELDLVQRLGRVVRFRPGHIAKIIILCIQDTVDQDWVYSATRNLNAAKINKIELSHLRMGLEQISFT